jgi:carbonic anhydrase/acetyltransferase-like protein (isoleucine patch superfamily)
MGIRPFQGKLPKLHLTTFIADGAQVIGDVEIGEESSIWYNTVVRGDVNSVRIGRRTNIQDLSVIHVEKGTHPVRIGDEVTVGHRVVLHGCTVGNRVLVGIGAIVLNGVVIEDESFIAAGTLLIPGTHVPSGSMVMGSPGRVTRTLTDAERAGLLTSAAGYVLNAKLHRGG